jgi:hypothetical protein
MSFQAEYISKCNFENISINSRQDQRIRFSQFTQTTRFGQIIVKIFLDRKNTKFFENNLGFQAVIEDSTQLLEARGLKRHTVH